MRSTITIAAIALGAALLGIAYVWATHAAARAAVGHTTCPRERCSIHVLESSPGLRTHDFKIGIVVASRIPGPGVGGIVDVQCTREGLFGEVSCRIGETRR